jgi:hypothetical protein
MRGTEGVAAYSLPVVGAVATTFALFAAAIVSPQALVAGMLINVLIVMTILRIGTLLTEITFFSFLFQLSLVSPLPPLHAKRRLM